MAAQTVETLQLTTSVELISDGHAFLALRNEWNSLLEDSRSVCFFLTHEWLFTWWKHLGGEYELAIRAVRTGKKLLAIAPLILRRPRPREGRLLPTLEFLGNGFAGSDYLDVIVRRGFETDAIQALAAELHAAGAKSIFALRLANTLMPGSIAAAVVDQLATQKWTVDSVQTNVCPYIPLAGHSWEPFLLSLGSETRYNFNRKWKRLNRDFAVEFCQADEASLPDSLSTLISQHNSRWTDRGGSDAFHTPELIGFHKEITRVALDRGWLRLYILRLNKTAAASLYGFSFGKKFYFYQSGLDRTYEKHSVGFLTMGLAIQRALSESVSEFDLLHGDESYKFHWTSVTRAIARMEVHPPGIRGVAARSCLQLGRISRNVARRVLSSTPK